MNQSDLLPSNQSSDGLPLKDGTFYEPTPEQIIRWQRAFSKVDVHAELNVMQVWCDANPSKRKTRRGVERFIVSWLSRAQERGGQSPDVERGASTSTRKLSMSEMLNDRSWAE